MAVKHLLFRKHGLKEQVAHEFEAFCEQNRVSAEDTVFWVTFKAYFRGIFVAFKGPNPKRD